MRGLAAAMAFTSRVSTLRTHPHRARRAMRRCYGSQKKACGKARLAAHAGGLGKRRNAAASVFRASPLATRCRYLTARNTAPARRTNRWSSKRSNVVGHRSGWARVGRRPLTAGRGQTGIRPAFCAGRACRRRGRKSCRPRFPRHPNAATPRCSVGADSSATRRHRHRAAHPRRRCLPPMRAPVEPCLPG